MTDTSIQDTMRDIGQRARQAAARMATATTAEKDAALKAIARSLEANVKPLTEANQKDLEAGMASGLSDALLDRLTLTPDRIDSMIQGLLQVASLKDPIGEISDMAYLPSGIQRGQMRVPLGVVGIIYESRPNVTIDATALCLKSGNAAILRGGKEAIHSNQALAEIVQSGLKAANMPADGVQIIQTTDRAAVGELITMPEYVDVIVPRGGKGLIERIARDARVPVIKHLDGVCHVYIDAEADRAQAQDIAFNAKTRRYGVCNAMETLLVHASVSDTLTELAERFRDAGVELRGCNRTCALIDCAPASEDDWYTEYLAPILSVRIVDSAEEAMDHINHYGSHHTDAIVTRDFALARRFMTQVDSASVMVNASTAFADGAEYGLGAEIGISTDKIHARGPVGLVGLTSQKYIVFGDGHIRS